jgi:hypothetical protein
MILFIKQTIYFLCAAILARTARYVLTFTGEDCELTRLLLDLDAAAAARCEGGFNLSDEQDVLREYFLKDIRSFSARSRRIRWRPDRLLR